MNSKGGVFRRARPPGAQKLLLLITIVIAGVLMCTREGFAQISPNQTPPQSNTTSSRPRPTNTGAPGKTTAGKTQSANNAPSKTQTAKTKTTATQSKSHQAGKQRGRGYSHGGMEVGIGATIDLGGIGQRRAEPDPFAVPVGPQPITASTKEKPRPAKRLREIAKSDPFAAVQLTGPQAKAESNP